jgi:hypothetical protein
MPVGIANGKMTLDRRWNLNYSSTQGEALEAFGPADSASNAEQSTNRFPNVMHAVGMAGIAGRVLKVLMA